MASGRTDPWQVTVLNHDTGERASSAGTKPVCDEFAKEQKKRWKGAKVDVEVTKRQGA